MELSELQGLVKTYSEKRRVKEAIEDTLEAANKEVTAIGDQILAVLIDSKMSNFRVDGIGLVSTTETESVGTPKTVGERKALWDYIKAKYGEETAYGTFSVNAQTLNAFFKQERASLPVDDAMLFKLPGAGEPKTSYRLSFRVDKGG